MERVFRAGAQHVQRQGGRNTRGGLRLPGGGCQGEEMRKFCVGDSKQANLAGHSLVIAFSIEQGRSSGHRRARIAEKEKRVRALGRWSWPTRSGRGSFPWCSLRNLGGPVASNICQAIIEPNGDPKRV